MKKEFCYDHPRPAYTVDIIIVQHDKVLLIERKFNPYSGQWALPGGFMDMDETPIEAAARELLEETAVVQNELSQFRTYGTLGRDPRQRTISTIFYAVLDKDIDVSPKAGDDAAKTKWWPLNDLPPMAFDHSDIMRDFLAMDGFFIR